MAFWHRVLANRADRAVGARGRAPNPEKLRRVATKAYHDAIWERHYEQRRAIESAAEATLTRLEAQGFPEP
jgi:hypothetical protein